MGGLGDCRTPFDSVANRDTTAVHAVLLETPWRDS